MDYFFTEEVKPWENVFQSIPAFEALIKEIFRREGLTFTEMTHLTPGTNVVFRVGDHVVKVFAPPESGFGSAEFFDAELEAMNRALQASINAPRVVATGCVQDKYVFKYMIMDYIQGQEAGDLVVGFNYERKLTFVSELKDILKKINTIPSSFDEAACERFIKNRALSNKNWKRANPELYLQVSDRVKNLKLTDYAYVHGDITGENVIIDSNDDIFVIDFADSIIAPKEYEYSPIIFELLKADKELARMFAEGIDEFWNKLFRSALIHEYSYECVKAICMLNGTDIADVNELSEVEGIMKKYFTA